MNIVSSHICCYYFHYLYSWLFLKIILHTHFSLHLYLKPFLFIQIPHKIRFKSKIHTRGDKECRKMRNNKKSPFCSSKRTVCCFGEGIELNMITLLQVSAILIGNQSGIKLANRLGLCSRSCFPVLAEAASTCWVFTSNYFVLNPILALFVVESSGKKIAEGATATYLEIQFRNTKVVLIALFCVSRIRCYYFY